MNRNTILAILVSILLVIFAVFLIQSTKNPKTEATESLSSPLAQEATSSAEETDFFSNNEDILKNALNLYIQKKAQEIDMKDGPCLGLIATDWVLDIAHNPRQAVDEKSENQCPEFISGQAHHFIELDPNGKLIRSR